MDYERIGTKHVRSIMLTTVTTTMTEIHAAIRMPVASAGGSSDSFKG